MERRKALKLMGALVACLGGTIIIKPESKLKAEDSANLTYLAEPQSYQFNESGIKNVIIIRTNGKKISIPFSEICDALGEQK